MEKQIKLKPKQLEQIAQIQNQKAQLNKMFSDLNEREAAIISLILEINEVAPETVGTVDLKEGNLVLKLQEPKTPKKKMKVVKD